MIEGESYATAYLARLHAGITQPDELALIVEFLHGGEMLRGLCRAIEKALGERHA